MHEIRAAAFVLGAALAILMPPYASGTHVNALPSSASRSSAIRQEVPNIPALIPLPPSIEREIGGNPATFTTQLSDRETRVEMWHPMCFQKKIALLGTFCVAPTTDEDDKDPQHLLPRLTFEVKREEKSPPLTVFLFDDEESSWPRFWSMVVRNNTCEEMGAHAKATIYEDPNAVASASSPYGAQIHSFKNIRGRFAHHWHLVAVDCERRECPEVRSANITFFHPNSNGKNDACASNALLGQSVGALKDAMAEGLHALSIRNVLDVVGLSHFGVFVLYVIFMCMLLFSLLFLIWGIRSESSRRFVYLNTFFMTSISAMAYLALATGNGILVLRKVPTVDETAGYWRISDPLLAHKGSVEHPNPMYLEAYGSAPTYPVLYARHVNQLLTTPLALVDLFLVSGVSMNTRVFMLFCNTMMGLCWLAGAFITSASRWAFWLFGSVFGTGVLLPLIGILPTSAARKGRGSRRLYGRLMCISMLTGILSPWVWILVEGAHALPADAAVLLYGILDVVSQCIFGLLLLRKAPPVLADWDIEYAAQAKGLTAGAGDGGAAGLGIDPNDDL